MTDIGRKDVSTQIAEKTTPQSQKTTGEKVKESVTGAIDKAKAVVTPNSQKSTTQQVVDSSHGNHHSHHSHY